MVNGPKLTLRQVGEFAVIDRLVAHRRQPEDVVVGPGDDAAVLHAGAGNIVMSTDMLVQGKHFRFDWSSPHDVGRKAIAQNAADIEAMGARPTAFVVAFGACPDTAVSEVEELTEGMWQEANSIHAGIVGGDLVSSSEWVVSVTALGYLDNRPPVLRSGAQAGSVVAVAGNLGYSAAGYALWCNHSADNSVEFEEMKRRHLVPQPPYGEGIRAAEAKAQAMTDISDGLLADLGHLAAASGVTVDLSRAALNADVDALAAPAAATHIDPWSWVLGGGEDHALVACFAHGVPSGWREIGVVRAGASEVLVDGCIPTSQPGWQSFSC